MYFGGIMPFHFFQNVDIEEAESFTVRRVGSTLGGSSAAAAFFELMVPLALALTFWSKKHIYSLLMGGVSFLSLFALSFTFSRTGLITISLSIVFLIAFLLMFKDRIIKRSWIVLLANPFHPQVVLLHAEILYIKMDMRNEKRNGSYFGVFY